MTTSPSVAAPPPGGTPAPGPARTLVTAPRAVGAAPQVEIVVPVLDEERSLAASVRRLHRHLQDAPYTWRVTVADNASTDGTLAVARGLARELPGVQVVHLPRRGRGGALHAVWSASDAQVLAYMDVDLSTDLKALLPLVAPLLSGHSDLVIGSRLARSARVARRPKRELVSRCYNLLLHRTLHVHFSDAQCGFKAIRADRAAVLLPHVRDTGWFFDTELLVLAERTGLRIGEVPVDWVDDPDSRVDLVATAREDLRGIARLARGLADGSIPVDDLRRELRSGQPPTSLTRQVARFAAVGVLSTLAYLVLYVALRGPAGPQAANAASLLLTAMLNTAANRRWTFASRAGVTRTQVQGLAVLAATLVLTGGSLRLLHALDPDPPRALGLGVLVAANLAATVLRFLLLRHWVFARRASPAPTTSRSSA